MSTKTKRTLLLVCILLIVFSLGFCLFYYISESTDYSKGVFDVLELALPDDGEEYIGILAIKLNDNSTLARIVCEFDKHNISYTCASHLATDLLVHRDCYKLAKSIVDKLDASVRKNIIFVYKRSLK